MKAKTYYENHKSDVATQKPYACERTILHEFDQEFVQTAAARKVKSIPAKNALIMEFNEKWNSLIRLFAKGGMEEALHEDAFLEYKAYHNPYLMDQIRWSMVSAETAAEKKKARHKAETDAIDKYAKAYEPAVGKHDADAIAAQLLHAFNKDFEADLEARKVHSRQGSNIMIMNYNARWNRLVVRLLDDNGKSVLAQDGFLTYKSHGKADIAEKIRASIPQKRQNLAA